MGFVIDIANDITGLSIGYQAAIKTAVDFFENTITTNMTVNLTFDWAALGSGDLAQNVSEYGGYTYSQVYNAIQRIDGASTASPVQQAAAALLAKNFSTSDPTHGGQFLLTAAEADELGLDSTVVSSDATISLNDAYNYTWSQTGGIAANTYDAVGAIEHEISEALGRTAFLGTLQSNMITGRSGLARSYNILDLFHYGAAGNAGSAAYGSAAGALEEPFVSGYNSNVQTYFSFNGTTVTLPFDSPAEVAAGDDVADWSATVHGDSFGSATAGVVDAISPTDLETLNVLGYSLTSASCFCAGVRVATPGGEVAVETLRRGDLATTHDGRAVPVSWVGVQTVSRRFADPLRVLPIRISAGALGENVPSRDLLLSPDHALFVDGILIQAGALVNGSSITRQTAMPEIFIYYHVETDDHSLILAENAPAETFVDNVDRMKFDNWAEHEALYPDGKPVAELPLPRAKSRRQVPPGVKAALDERARVIGAVASAA